MRYQAEQETNQKIAVLWCENIRILARFLLYILLSISTLCQFGSSWHFLAVSRANLGFIRDKYPPNHTETTPKSPLNHPLYSAFWVDKTSILHRGNFVAPSKGCCMSVVCQESVHWMSTVCHGAGVFVGNSRNSGPLRSSWMISTAKILQKNDISKF